MNQVNLQFAKAKAATPGYYRAFSTMTGLLYCLGIKDFYLNGGTKLLSRSHINE